jgi:hypothetical protein
MAIHACDSASAAVDVVDRGIDTLSRGGGCHRAPGEPGVRATGVMEGFFHGGVQVIAIGDRGLHRGIVTIAVGDRKLGPAAQ